MRSVFTGSTRGRRPQRTIAARPLVGGALGALALLLALSVLAWATPVARAVPFGSYAALQKKMQSGAIVETVPQGRFIVARYDDWGLVSYRVAEVKRDPSRRPRVFVLGDSSARECFTTDAAMQAALVRRWGGRIKVLTLASSIQRLSGTLAAIDNLPSGRGGVVVIGIHEYTFAGSLADTYAQLRGNPLMMRSRALQALVRARYGGRPLNTMIPGLRRHLAWYAQSRRVPAFRGNPRPYHRHRYDFRVPVTLAANQALVSDFIATTGAPSGTFFQAFALNRALLRRCVSLARAKGYQVLLMEDPEEGAVIGHRWDVYKQRLRSVCRGCVSAYGAHYVDLNKRTSLVPGDFYDAVHLRRPGREKWTGPLTTAILAILRDHPPIYLGAMTASLSDVAPTIAPDATETATCNVTDTAGKHLRGATVTFVWHAAGGDTTVKVKSNAAGVASSTVDISALSPDVRVPVDVVVVWKGRRLSQTLAFTPVAPATSSPSPPASSPPAPASSPSTANPSTSPAASASPSTSW